MGLRLFMTTGGQGYEVRGSVGSAGFGEVSLPDPDGREYLWCEAKTANAIRLFPVGWSLRARAGWV